MTVQEVLERVKKEGIQAVDLRFMDFPGLWQHFTIPAKHLDEDTFAEGLGFDGSSIRGWKGIEASDMVVVPDPSTAFLDPFAVRILLSGNRSDTLLVTPESNSLTTRRMTDRIASTPLSSTHSGNQKPRTVFF